MTKRSTSTGGSTGLDKKCRGIKVHVHVHREHIGRQAMGCHQRYQLMGLNFYAKGTVCLNEEQIHSVFIGQNSIRYDIGIVTAI
jgi:hypothetical protein